MWLKDYVTTPACIADEHESCSSRGIESKGVSQWQAAMEEEMKSLSKNNIWELVELPMGQKAMGCKRAFKIKKTMKGMLKDTSPLTCKRLCPKTKYKLS